MTIKWEDKYSVGIEQIDDQHRVLINIINNLQNIYDNRGLANFNKEILKALDALKMYTLVHFKCEEILMEMFDYQGCIEHKESHDGFIKLINGYHSHLMVSMNQRDNIEEIESNFAEIDKIDEEIYAKIEKIIHFLKTWLLNHIMKGDKEYSQFFLKIQSKAKESGGWMSFLKN